jgi:hypothetical protein
MRSIHIATFALATLLSTPIVFAHEGHAHTSIMGSVTKLDRGRIVVKTREGKTVSIALTSDTEYQGQGGEDSRRDIKLGDRVVVKAMGEGVDLSADEVRFSHAGGRENSGQSDVESPRRHSRPSDYDDDAASDAEDEDYR